MMISCFSLPELDISGLNDVVLNDVTIPIIVYRVLTSIDRSEVLGLQDSSGVWNHDLNRCYGITSRRGLLAKDELASSLRVWSMVGKKLNQIVV